MASSEAGGGRRITGGTRLAAVIGDPVRHSLSPVIHNAAFAALDLDWVYVALPVAEGRAAEALTGMRALGIDGLSVTMPHKAAVAAAVDDCTTRARLLGAVNCVSRNGDRLVGDNTDGPGFIAGLADDLGLDPAGHHTVVLGAGGAARAVVLALAEAGAASVTVVNRGIERAVAASALAGPVGRGLTPGAEADDAIRAATLVVNATPVGMGGDRGAVPCDPALLGTGRAAVDLIYTPLETAWLAGASAAGAHTANGVSMLVHQAAIAFERWTGRSAPIPAIRAALVPMLHPG